ncbi:MAG: hypothetical protein KDD42_03220 [Bdellovibrionales bacterium]|nr:hypothetical protein [Bdellovibrionales bacterium]
MQAEENNYNTGDSISALVYRLLRGPEVLVASPETIRKMAANGEPLRQVPDIPTEQAIDKLFEQRKAEAKEIADSLLPAPIPEAVYLYLYDQIRACALFGLFGPAITYCGLLVEYALKACTYIVESNGNPNFSGAEWDEFETLTFGQMIPRAQKAGLIDEGMVKQFRGFKNDIRNTHSHFNIKKIAQDVVIRNVSIRNVETGETEVRDVPGIENPVFQVFAKEAADKNYFPQIFHISDTFTQHLICMTARLVPEQETANGV